MMPSTRAKWMGAKSSLVSRSRDHHALDPVVPVLGDHQIAVDIDASERTIKAHRAHLMAKLQVQSVAELAHLAHEVGFAGGR